MNLVFWAFYIQFEVDQQGITSTNNGLLKPEQNETLHILNCVIIHMIYTTDYGFKRLIQDLRYIPSSRLKLCRTAPLFGYQNGLKCNKEWQFYVY